MSEPWEAVLDLLEAEVDAAWAAGPEAAAAGEAPVFAPSAELGPVPAGLVERATSLLHRMNDLQENLEQRRGEVARQLSALAGARTAAATTAARPLPHFLDTTA